jgi:hypothetical protein
MSFSLFYTNFGILNEFSEYLKDKENSGNEKLVNNVWVGTGPRPSCADSA